MGLLSPNNQGTTVPSTTGTPTGTSSIQNHHRRPSTSTTATTATPKGEAKNWNTEVTVMYNLYLQIGANEKTFLQKGKCVLSPNETIQTLLAIINDDNLTDYMATNYGGEEYMGSKVTQKDYVIAQNQLIDTLFDNVFNSSTQIDIIQMYRPKTVPTVPYSTPSLSSSSYPVTNTNDRAPATYSYVNTHNDHTNTQSNRRPSLAASSSNNSTTGATVPNTKSATLTPTVSSSSSSFSTLSSSTVVPPVPKTNDKENNDVFCFILCLAIFFFYSGWLGVFLFFLYFYSKSNSAKTDTSRTTDVPEKKRT